jgi:hypothetical protein
VTQACDQLRSPGRLGRRGKCRQPLSINFLASRARCDRLSADDYFLLHHGRIVRALTPQGERELERMAKA